MRLSAELIASCEQRMNPLGERELVLRGLGIPTLEHLGATRDQYDSLDFTDNRLGPTLDNLPRLSRLQSLHLAHNLLEGLPDNVKLLRKNVGSTVTTLILSHNAISSLAQIKKMGQAFPKLQLLSLVGNPVTRSKERYFVPKSRCAWLYIFQLFLLTLLAPTNYKPPPCFHLLFSFFLFFRTTTLSFVRDSSYSIPSLFGFFENYQDRTRQGGTIGRKCRRCCHGSRHFIWRRQ